MVAAERIPPGLGQLVERLGSTLLTLKAGPRQPARGVRSVVLFDPLDLPDVSDAVVLGIGVASADDLAALVKSLGEAGAAALVVREPLEIDRSVAGEADRGDLSLLALVRGASWIHVATLLTGALHLNAANEPSMAPNPDRDLFALANSLSTFLNAPVTIEDLSSRVVAFSADQGGTDEPRRRTILGLQVPEAYSEFQRESGQFRRIYSSPSPLYLQDPAPDTLPRVAMRIQAGEETLGSIWAAVSEPLSPDRELAMIEASQVVALEMLRTRISADASQRLGVALVSMLLEGGPAAREAAQKLAFGKSPACVMAFRPMRDGDEVRAAADLHRAAVALRTHLRPTFPRAVAAQVGGVVYAVVPIRATDSRTSAAMVDLAAEFIARLDTSTTFCAGLGGTVDDVDRLDTSRRDADAATRVLRSRPDDGRRVARFAEVAIDSLVLRLGDLVEAEGIQFGGQLAVLREYDEVHGTQLMATAQSWLEHFGDVTAAARAVHVHKNTFRYRLDRIEAIAGIDLSDPDERFGLMLQFRLRSL